LFQQFRIHCSLVTVDNHCGGSRPLHFVLRLRLAGCTKTPASLDGAGATYRAWAGLSALFQQCRINHAGYTGSTGNADNPAFHADLSVALAGIAHTCTSLYPLSPPNCRRTTLCFLLQLTWIDCRQATLSIGRCGSTSMHPVLRLRLASATKTFTALGTIATAYYARASLRALFQQRWINHTGNIGSAGDPGTRALYASVARATASIANTATTLQATSHANYRRASLRFQLQLARIDYRQASFSIDRCHSTSMHLVLRLRLAGAAKSPTALGANASANCARASLCALFQ